MDAAVTSSNEEGIIIQTASRTTGDINVTANGNIMAGKNGINVDRNGNGAVNVTTEGDINSGTAGIYINTANGISGDVTVTVNGDITGATEAVYLTNLGSGNAVLNISGDLSGAASSGYAISLTSGGDARIRLRDGASVVRGDININIDGTGIFEVTGTDSNSFSFGDLVPNSSAGFDNFEKTGSGTWTITGTHASGSAFEQTNINGGKLVWEGTTFRTTNLIIADGAALEITGSSSFTNTSVTLSGRLELTGNSASVTVGSLTGNGAINIDVDFSGGDEELTDARLAATSVTGTIPVNIKSMGEFQVSNDDEDGVVTVENFLSVADSDAFEEGNVLDNGNFNFDLVYDSANSQWNLVARPGRLDDEPGDSGEGVIAGSIEGVLYESLAAVLTQLVDLETRQQRLLGRQHAGNTAIWGRITGGVQRARTKLRLRGNIRDRERRCRIRH